MEDSERLILFLYSVLHIFRPVNLKVLSSVFSFRASPRTLSGDYALLNV